jgi:gliding motility-associated-like protein
MKSILLTLLATFTSLGMSAQVFNIIDENIFTCGGVIVDSGGEGGPGYENNENYVLQVCPEFVGGSVNISWPSFNLSTAGSAPTDRIIIYDGPDVASPVLGTWSGTNNPGLQSASFANSSGCLTIQFISNETGTSSFAANVSCVVSCEPPTPVVSVAGITTFPALVCQNETITFDASASTVASGFNITQYRWIFADGTEDITSGPVATHAYTVPGAYTVRLVLTDNNNCESTEAIDLQFLVSTTPDFSASNLSGSTICLGESVILSATGVVPVTWSGVPVADFGEGIYLPDNQSTPFVSNLTFESFQSGATITSVDQIVSICVSMEHSYMGDLRMTLICPNGSMVNMHDQGGGGTYLGNALDFVTNPPVPGGCLEYCWSPTATNGTWAENSQFGATPNVQPSALPPPAPQGFTLVPNTYASVEPIEQLVGCPLNGTWQFVARDLIGADDGFICSWSVTFESSLYPDLTTFTPVLGTTLDSASWNGPGITTDPQTPYVAVATPTTEGNNVYTFSITDNFGCTYDTTVTIFVNPGIAAPVLISGNAQFCEGGITYLSAPAGYTSYQWSNSSVGQSISVSQSGTYVVTVFSGDCSLPSEPFVVTAVPAPTPVITGPGFSCGGVPATLGTTQPYSNYTWSNSATTPTITVGTGTYSVSVTESGCSGTSAPFTVTVGSNPQANFTVTPPSPQAFGVTADFADASAGNGSSIVGWSWNFGTPDQNSTSPNPSITFDTPGTYPVTLTVTTADGCESTITINYVVLASQVIIPNVFTPNGDGKNDRFEIENGQYYSNTLAIYNRWGNVVYETKNYRNTWGASDVADGTYYYVFTTVDDNKEYTGHVTILR